MSREKPSHHVRFGLFEFDSDRGELRREGRPVRLPPQPARVLALLLENAGQLVEREEFKRRIWGESHVEFDAGINFSIRQIREALGDRAESPRYIQTVRGRGYRFINPVETVDPARARRSRLALSTAVGIGAVMMLVIVAAIGAARRSPGGVVGSDHSKIEDLPSSSPEARAELLKGRYQLAKDTDEGIGEGRRALRAGGRARARRGSALPRSSHGGGYVSVQILRTTRSRARSARDGAEIDPNLAEGYSQLGTRQFFVEWDWEGARSSFERALALDPSLSSAEKGLAFYYSSRGEHQTAIDHVEKAVQLDPVSVNLQADLGWFLLPSAPVW